MASRYSSATTNRSPPPWAPPDSVRQSAVSPGYSVDALNVSQVLMSPVVKPVLNHRERCAELP